MADSKPQGRVESTSREADLDSGPVPGGCFHSKRGTDVELSKGNTEAAIVIKNYRPTFDGNSTLHPVRRLVFSSEPIKPTGIFQVYVSRRKCKIKFDGRYIFLSDDESGPYFIAHHYMALGFIALDPNMLADLPPKGAVDCWHNSPDVWMLCGDSVYHGGLKEIRVNLSLFKPKYNTVGCRVNSEGYLEFIMDGKNHGVVWSRPLPMDRPLWGFVDLPIEYKIQACFTQGLEIPPSYHSSAREIDPIPVPNSLGMPTPVPNSLGMPTPVPNSLGMPTPVPNSLGMTNPVPNSLRMPTPVPNSLGMPTPVPNSLGMPIPVPNSLGVNQEVANTESTMDQKLHHMQQELISSFQRQLDGHRKHLEDEFQRNLEDQKRRLEESFQQRMQQELASNLQKHSDALLEMQGQLQSQLTQLESYIQKLKM